MNWMGIAGLVLVVMSLSLMLINNFMHRDKPNRGLRQVAAYSRLRRAIGLAVEDGSRLHVSLGSAEPLSSQTASAFLGLAVTDRISQLSSLSDRPPIVTSGDGMLGTLSQDALRAGFRSADALEEFEANRGRVSGLTPFSYAVGAVAAVKDENVSANILSGHFGPEVILITDAIEQQNAFSLAGSDTLTGQAVLYATTQEPLIGEELFAAGAYLQVNSFHSASLRAQDAMRWFLFGILIAGFILRLAGLELR